MKCLNTIDKVPRMQESLRKMSFLTVLQIEIQIVKEKVNHKE